MIRTEKEIQKILEYVKNNPNSSARDIARGIDPKGLSYTALRVSKYLYPSVCDGKVQRTYDASNNIYFYSIGGLADEKA